MDGHALKNRVVLLQLEALSCILPILRCDVAGCTWHTAILMLGAFEDDLHSITFSFLCHDDCLLYLDFT